jgi:hypothetical protein
MSERGDLNRNRQIVWIEQNEIGVMLGMSGYQSAIRMRERRDSRHSRKAKLRFALARLQD